MPSHTGSEEEEEDDDDIGIDNGFQNHLDALKRACCLNFRHDNFGTTTAGSVPDTPSSALEEDDEELFDSIQKKYSDVDLYLEKDSLTQRRTVIGSDDDEDEDDEEILRSVENLFGANELAKLSQRKEKVQEPADFPEFETTSSVSAGCKAPEESSSKSEDLERAVICPAKALGRAVSTLLPSNWNDEEDPEFATPSPVSPCVPFDPYKQHADILSSTEYEKLGYADKEKVMADALKKNQSFQQRMRIILNRIESKQKQNAEMQKRVRTLVDFEKYCKRRYAGFFTDQANPSLKLFSVRGDKREASDKNEYNSSGPSDNPDVEAHKKLKQKAMFASTSRKWRVDERRDLAKGVKQQVYEVLVCEVMDAISNGDAIGDNALEDALNDIRRKELTSQDLRDAIGGVNWDQIARVYVVNRSAAECRTRWLNHEDPLINKSPWTKMEDKKLLSIAQRNNMTNWEKITEELGTKRTPAECLMRYQRSLNASIMRSNWTPEEDVKLRAAVEEHGESNWGAVARCLEGRNNSQCLMRWYKVLHPGKHRKGRWSVEEDKRLKWAVSVYGAKKWKQIAEHVPGRTDIQCRERWCNVLDPDINVNGWTEEEDQALRDSITRHGPHRWAAISADLKTRTHKQCLRRWKFLFPELLSEYRRNIFIQRNALVNNFQGRKKERPKLGPQDFVSKAENFAILSKESNKKVTKRPVPKESSSMRLAYDSAGNNSATDQRNSNRSHSGALREVPVGGDDAPSDPKIRRLARINKLKLARASKLVSNISREGPLGRSQSKISNRDTPRDEREEAGDLPSTFQVHTDKGKRRSRSKSSHDQGKPTQRPRQDVAKKYRLDTVRSDTESTPQTNQVPDTLLTLAETESLAAGEVSPVTNGPAEVVTNSSTLDNVRGRSKKRSRKDRSLDQTQPTRRSTSSRVPSLSRESEAQIMSKEPRLDGPRPEVLALFELVQAVNDFCKYSSLIYEGQDIPDSASCEMSNTAFVFRAEETSGGPISRVADLRNNFLLERYPRSVQDFARPTVGTECVSINEEVSRAEMRMVPSTAPPGGICDVSMAPGQADGVFDAPVDTRSNTVSTVAGAEENITNSVSELSNEDEEVEAATKAILSLPFFYGVQHLMQQATEFLNAKPSRKRPAARSVKPRKKGKTSDVNAESQLVTANACPVPKRPRSARCRAKRRGSVQETGSDVNSVPPGPSNSACGTEPVASADK